MSRSTAEYLGSRFWEKVTPPDAMSNWNRERKAIDDKLPLVVVSRPGEESMFLNDGGYFLPTRQFADGSSLLRLEALNRVEADARGAVVIANLQSAADIVNIRGLGRELRQTGINNVLLIASRLYGQRQDEVFVDHDTGQPISDTVTSVDTLDILAAVNRPNPRRLFHRLAILEPHSSKLFQQASILGLPTIGLSAYRWIAKKTGLFEAVDETFGVLGPDKGRHTTAHLLARDLGLEVFSFNKQRDRETGKLKLVDPEETLQKMARAGIKKGLIFDDEIQKGSTTALIVEAAGLDEVTILATHANFSQETKDNLTQPGIKKVVVTNAMKPSIIKQQLPAGDKLEVLDIWPSLVELSKRLWSEDPVEVANDGLVLDPWFS